MDTRVLTYEGCNFLRQRLVLATLSSRPVRITKLREDADEPGLKEFEAGFIRLLDKLTNGSRIEVNETGTTLLYHPGLLLGGTLDHDCSQQRSIGYFLEPLLLLAPFAKKPVRITLRGITNGPDDPSVDYYRMCVVPLLKKFLPDNDLEVKIRRRGVWPSGSGEVLVSCPTVRKMRPVQLTEEGKVRRVRGIAYCVRVSPSMANRMVDSTRSVLNQLLPDVYIYTDAVKGAEAEKSPGYGLTLVSESTTGVTHASESSSLSHSRPLPPSPVPVDRVSGEGCAPMLPEDIGQETASQLVQEIVRGGYADSGSQVFPLLFMALAEKDVSRLQLGELTPYTMQFLRHLRDFFQLTFKVDCKDDEQLDSIPRQTVTLSCVGVGFSNFSRGIV